MELAQISTSASRYSLKGKENETALLELRCPVLDSFLCVERLSKSFIVCRIRHVTVKSRQLSTTVSRALYSGTAATSRSWIVNDGIATDRSDILRLRSEDTRKDVDSFEDSAAVKRSLTYLYEAVSNDDDVPSGQTGDNNSTNDVATSWQAGNRRWPACDVPSLGVGQRPTLFGLRRERGASRVRFDRRKHKSALTALGGTRQSVMPSLIASVSDSKQRSSDGLIIRWRPRIVDGCGLDPAWHPQCCRKASTPWRNTYRI